MNSEISLGRFAPMQRLLTGEDEEYLLRQGFRREAVQLRAHHRKLYFRFVAMLEKEYASVHEARKAAMAQSGWNFESLLRDRATASYYLWTMRTAGMMHLLHLPQAARLADQAAAAMFQAILPTPVVPVTVPSA
jgi:hypothetical protein